MELKRNFLKKEKVSLSKYYSDNHAYEFLICAHNLIRKADLYKFLDSYDITSKKIDGDNMEYRKFTMELSSTYGIDEFNFLMVRIAVALEISLKGIALYKGYNIFKLPEVKLGGKNFKLIKHCELINRNKNIRKTNTFGMVFFINHLSELLSKKQSEKYKEMFLYFKNERDTFVHFAKRSHPLFYEELFLNTKLLLEYFDKLIKPLKEEVALKESNATSKIKEKEGR